jgi:hypothetical protein
LFCSFFGVPKIAPIKLLATGPFSINDCPIVFFLYSSAALEMSNNYSVKDLLIFSINLSLKFFILASKSRVKSFVNSDAEKLGN